MSGDDRLRDVWWMRRIAQQESRALRILFAVHGARLRVTTTRWDYN